MLGQSKMVNPAWLPIARPCGCRLCGPRSPPLFRLLHVPMPVPSLTISSYATRLLAPPELMREHDVENRQNTNEECRHGQKDDDQIYFA